MASEIYRKHNNLFIGSQCSNAENLVVNTLVHSALWKYTRILLSDILFGESSKKKCNLFP